MKEGDREEELERKKRVWRESEEVTRRVERGWDGGVSAEKEKKGHSKWKSKEIKGQDGGKVMRDKEKAIQVLNRAICLLFIYIF